MRRRRSITAPPPQSAPTPTSSPLLKDPPKRRIRSEELSISRLSITIKVNRATSRRELEVVFRHSKSRPPLVLVVELRRILGIKQPQGALRANLNPKLRRPPAGRFRRRRGASRKTVATWLRRRCSACPAARRGQPTTNPSASARVGSHKLPRGGARAEQPPPPPRSPPPMARSAPPLALRLPQEAWDGTTMAGMAGMAGDARRLRRPAVP